MAKTIKRDTIHANGIDIGIYTTDYKTKIERYFNCIDNICENYFGFNDTYEIEGYIEGKIGEKNVKGIFNGKVRVKRIELNN